jgi:hypothetical protein
VSIAPLVVAKVSPDGKLVLNGSVVSNAPGALDVVWSASTAPAGAPDLVDFALTPLTQPLIVLAPGALVPNSTHVLTLLATNVVGGSSASIAVPVAARPSGAPGVPPQLRVSPSTGTAFDDSFTLTSTDWVANELVADAPAQLEYAFSYTIAEKPGEPPVLLADFGPSPNVTFLLPAGSMTFAVTARNAYGALSTIGITASATSALPPGLTDATELLGAVGGATSNALAGGNAAGASSLAGAMAALLNDPTATATTSDEQQQAARGELLATLTDAASRTTTPGTLSAAAAATANVVSGSLSAAGAADAVGLLGTLAGAPGGTLPLAAAGSVAGSLSSLGSSTNASLLSSLSGVVSQLGSSCLAQLSAPGESFVVSSGGVQMALSLNDAGAGSSLFSAPLTVEGSAASFAPLPAGALANAPAGVPVQTTFSALAFDPFTGSTTSTGVVRLAFSSPDGGEISVRDLAQPITFAMPALALAEGMQAVCRFWDEPAGAFSTDGCATMPNPAPAASFLALAWKTDIVLSSPALVASAWSATGPLAAGCSEVVIDCANATQRKRSVVLDPTDIFATPPVGCGGAESGVLRIFSGAGCALYRAGNAAGCAWSTVNQSFSGAGCVVANATQCACTHLTSFSGEPTPKIAVCSASDMVNLDPGDLVRRATASALHLRAPHLTVPSRHR